MTRGMPALPTLARHLLAPAVPDRTTALSRMERTSAITHLIASLEYLSRPSDRRTGGFNDWEVSGRTFRARSRRLGQALGVLADRRVTTAAHALRVPAALSLLAPLPPRARLAADAALTGSSLALYPRHHYGTDGSDQVSFLVQGAATLARLGQRDPRIVDAALWSVALQSVLSYAVSGWAKLAGPSWRNGEALEGVTRTLTYGDRTAWRLFKAHPRLARAMGGSVLAMECLFPAVFLGKGRLAAPMLAAASAFHVSNARIMGLGRFVWSFMSMHPAVLYATGPRERRNRRGRLLARRDDTLPSVFGGLLAGALGGAIAAQGRRRGKVAAGRGDERRLRTRSGASLAYRVTGAADGPVVVLENGLLSTPEHWEWVARRLGRSHRVVSYSRAGYGPSGASRGPRPLDTAVDDLLELVDAVSPDRPAIVAGHSLGGWLAVRAAVRAPSRIAGAALLDSSHPAELARSSRQAQGQAVMTNSLALMPLSLSAGLGLLLKRPDWVDDLPAHVRPLALAQYRDPRLWHAGKREWEAVLAEFGAFDGTLPPVPCPLLVMTAGYTARNDAIQLELHHELAAAAEHSEHHVIEDADHDSVLTDAEHAAHAASLIEAFAARTTRKEADRVALAH